MVDTQKESGLSEVIGFILIIAILVVIASLYVTYVVPAHGREAEIAHMTYIKNQFVDFKMGMDSLWINSQLNTPLSQNLEMGTLGQKTEGQFVFLPLTQPIGSDGEMSVSTDPGDGTIKVQVNGLFKDSTDISKNGEKIVNPDVYRIQDYYKYMNLEKISNIIPVFIPDKTTIDAATSDINLMTLYPNSSLPDQANWTMIISLTKSPFFTIPTQNISNFETTHNPIYMNATFQNNVIMSLFKRNETFQYPVMENFTLKSGVLPGEVEWINLQDPAYGLDVEGPITIQNQTGIKFSGSISITQNTDLALNYSQFLDTIKSDYEYEPVLSDPADGTAMGKFSYVGKNYYWVSQEYFYQMGGVFLTQNLTEGGVAKVLPLISLGVYTNQTGGRTPTITINKLLIKGEKSTIAGSSAIQYSSQISNISSGCVWDSDSNQYKYLAPTPENARSVSITIGPSTMSTETRDMWTNTFKSILYSANITSGFDTNWVDSSNPSGNVVFAVNGPDDSNILNDVTVEYSEINASVILQPVGWQGS